MGYRRVCSEFWTGQTGPAIRSLGADAQVVALYLMTCPSSNDIGLYYLPIPTLAHETGRGIEGASKGLHGLSEVGFAHQDGASETVFLPEMARYQIGETIRPGDRRHSWIVDQAKAVVKSTFFAQFYERYKVPFRLPEMPHRSPIEGASKPHRSNPPPPPPPPFIKNIWSSEQNEDDRSEHSEQSEAARPKREPSKARASDQQFDAFWNAYPRKVAKGAARKAWLSLAPDLALATRILAAVELHKRLPGWLKDGGEFIPHPATWLRARRWEDELSVPPSNGNGGSPTAGAPYVPVPNPALEKLRRDSAAARAEREARMAAAATEVEA